jgi:AmmeMemoRadiSam system protein A
MEEQFLTQEEQFLTQEEQAYLLDLARATIEAAVRSGGDPTASPTTPPTPRLEAPGAAFVTLHTRAGELRGCIGSLIARRPLVEDVRENALAAAFRDPRFPPLTEPELDDIVVEVSVLTEPVPLDYEDAEDLVRQLRPGVDGVILARGWNRGTFLPQVWEQLPAPEAFLEHLCLKAGLPPDAWRRMDLNISTYQVQKFEEEP